MDSKTYRKISPTHRLIFPVVALNAAVVEAITNLAATATSTSTLRPIRITRAAMSLTKTKTRTQGMGAAQATKVISLAEAVVETTTAVAALWTLVQIISSEAVKIMLTNSMLLANITAALTEVAVEVVAVAVATTKVTETAMRSSRNKTTKWTLPRPKHSVHRSRVNPSCQ